MGALAEAGGALSLEAFNPFNVEERVMDHRNPLDVWIQKAFAGKKSKRAINVPRYFETMSCGCRRSSVVAPGDASVVWHLTREDDDIVHRECGSVVLSLRAVPQAPLWGGDGGGDFPVAEMPARAATTL